MQITSIASGPFVNVCNCKNAKSVGLLDIEEPQNCYQPVTPSITLDYDVYQRIQPNTTGVGFLCMKWKIIKTVNNFFFCAKVRTNPRIEIPVARQDCHEMIKTLVCKQDNHMDKTMTYNGKGWIYSAEPEGDGEWPKEATYITNNCIIEKLTMRQDCPDCPIFSNIGKTSDNPMSVAAKHGTGIIVWDPISVFQDPVLTKCNLNKTQSSTARISKPTADGTIHVIDDALQLDISIDNNTIICNKTAYFPFKGINGLFIRLNDNGKSHVQTKTNFEQQLTTLINDNSSPFPIHFNAKRLARKSKNKNSTFELNPQFNGNPLCQIVNNNYKCIAMDNMEDYLIITDDETLFAVLRLTRDSSNLKVQKTCISYNPDGELSLESCTNTTIKFNWDAFFQQMSTIVDGEKECLTTIEGRIFLKKCDLFSQN